MTRGKGTLEIFFSKVDKGSKSIIAPAPNNLASNENENTNDNDNENRKRVREETELLEEEIIGDPALRKPIDSYHVDVRGEMRRRYLAKGPCQPYGHAFPKSEISKVSRSFRDNWFKKFDWLEYSISKDAAYCLWCYLFAESHHKYGDDAFTKTGFRNWKKASERFQAHEGLIDSPHNYAKTKYFGYNSQRHNVDYVLQRKSSQMEEDYRTRLTMIVDVIRFLLGQGLAFRGHDESPHSIHRGNFLELLKWYCEHNKEVSKVLDLNAPGNNKLTSPKIQKQIVNACAMEVKKVILEEIGDTWFSILIDEARDTSVKEQMSIVLRFVNDKGDVMERFLGVVHVSDTSAQSLKNSIDDFFARYGLSMSRVRGQGYDGASNMRGEFNGLKALILKENEHAHYIHCFAHRLQLVVVANVSKNGYVCSFFEYLSMIVNVVGASCKRRDDLRQRQYDDLMKNIESGEVHTGRGMNQDMSLARAGDTRWGSHFNTIARLFDLWNPVKEVLQTVFEDGNDLKSRGLALGLIDKMESFEFVFIGQLMKHILGMINTLSHVLQQKNQNIGLAVQLIRVLKDELRDFRNDGWEKLLEEVSKFCSHNEIPVPIMEEVVPGRGRKTVDGQRRTHLHHFRVDIFLQVVDIICQEIDDRFTESNSELIMCISCLDPSDLFAKFDHERIVRLAELYSQDFSMKDLSNLRPQLHTYHRYVLSEPAFTGLCDIGALSKKMVELKCDKSFSLVYRLIVLALVLPVTTASVERSFSAMKIIKTDLRNTMGDEFLSDCLVCYAEKGIFVNVETEAILQRFQNMKSRRYQLPHTSTKCKS